MSLGSRGIRWDDLQRFRCFGRGESIDAAMKPSEVPFQTLCSFFDVVCRKMKPVMKHRHLRRFREKFIERTSEDVFSIYRLLAPAVSTRLFLAIIFHTWPTYEGMPGSTMASCLTILVTREENRLVHAQLDRERSNYGLKEANLVRFLVRACTLDPKTSKAAQSAENWRQAGVKNAGQFSKVMEEVSCQLPGFHAQDATHCRWHPA